MTETEVAKAQQAAPPATTRLQPPPPFPQMLPQQQNNQQHQQQRRSSPPTAISTSTTVTTSIPSTSTMSTLLFQPNAHYDPKQQDKKTQLINSFETHYNVIVQKYGQMPQTELIESLSNGTIDLQQGENGHHLGNGFLCGLLVEPANAEKYMNCLCKIATADNWNNAMTSVNIIILELYPQLRQQCRQQLVYFFEEAIRKNVRSLESALANMCRALSDGTEFRETCQVAHQFAQCLWTNRQVFTTMLQPRSYFPSTLFALFSRFIVDAVHVGSTGLMSADNFKQPLLAVCEYLIRERFTDLTLMGRDLVLSLMRLGKLSQFVRIWRSMLHNPTELSHNFTGIQHLLATPPPCQVLGNRVSLRISRKMADILKVHKAIYAAHQQQNPAAKAQQLQLQQELNRLYESLRATHLSGPDSGSIRSEIIRHIWAVLDINPASNEARASFLTWLLRTAKQGGELQWCKLVFFWDWYGFDQSTTQTAQIYADPIIFTMRHLLHNGQHPMANSLVDFLIKSVNLLYQPLGYYFVNSVTHAMKALELANFQIQALFSNTKLDPSLRDQMRAAFPDFFPKRMTSIADNLAEPSDIIDFDAIRGTPSTPTTPTEANAPSEPTAASLGQSSIGGATVLTNGKGPAPVGQAKQQHQTKLEARASFSEGKVTNTTAATTSARQSVDVKGGDQPALKKLKTSESLVDLKKVKLEKIVEKGESGSTAELSPRKRKRIKSKEDAVPIRKAKEKPPMEDDVPSAASISEGRLEIVQNEDDEAAAMVDSEEAETASTEGTSKQLPLSMLLLSVREEFREHLETLNTAIKQGPAGEDDAATAMQSLMDSIFADEMDDEQNELVALSLLRIFDTYLRKKDYFPSDDPSEENISEIMDHPLYRFFKVLSQSAENADSRKSLLAIAAKMRDECPRIGYLFLFYISSICQQGSRGDMGPSIRQAMDTYKAICTKLEVEWVKQLGHDLEQCHVDERDLFAHILISVLTRFMEYGTPPQPKLMRVICSCLDPRLLTQLMSEIVRENVVIFGEGNVLQLLTESLKWESFEQLMLWQLLQTEAVEFDKFFELLQRLNYAQHAEATSAILVIMRNMAPEPGASVMKNLLRNLLLRPPKKDLFTVDAIKLLIDYEENISLVAKTISFFAEKAIQDGDITAVGSSTSATNQKGKMRRVLTVETIFGHLDRLRENCLQKETGHTEKLLKHSLLLEMIACVRKSNKLTEIRSKFDELFALFDIMAENDEDSRSSDGKPTGRKGGGGAKHRKAKEAKPGIELDSREMTPPKKRKRKAKMADDDSDYSDEDY